MPTDMFVAMLERKLAAHGIAKVVPDIPVLSLSPMTTTPRPTALVKDPSGIRQQRR